MVDRQPFLDGKMCYLIINRGFKGKRIFYNETDYKYYFRLLRKYMKQFTVHILGFCLLEKTIYLLVLPKDTSGLSSFMEEVRFSYALFVNSKYDGDRHVWQKNYRKVLVQRDAELINYIKLIEFRPVKANITDNPIRYPWSSCSRRVLNRYDPMNIIASCAGGGK